MIKFKFKKDDVIELRNEKSVSLMQASKELRRNEILEIIDSKDCGIEEIKQIIKFLITEGL